MTSKRPFVVTYASYKSTCYMGRNTRGYKPKTLTSVCLYVCNVVFTSITCEQAVNMNLTNSPSLWNSDRMVAAGTGIPTSAFILISPMQTVLCVLFSPDISISWVRKYLQISDPFYACIPSLRSLFCIQGLIFIHVTQNSSSYLIQCVH
jgi:hypothetical protein